MGSHPADSFADRLDELFPIPGPPLSHNFPLRWPGVSAKSGKALADTLKQDFLENHVFFVNEAFHNHSSHQLMAMYCMGADGALIHAAGKYNERVQVPAYESPASVEASTFNDHLGDPKFYTSYLKFFVSQILDKGIGAVLEEYIFSDKANTTVAGGKQPFMLSRFLDSLVHPMIHAGGGTELNLPGLVSEGLAMAAVHQSHDVVLFPPSVFGKQSIVSGTAASITSGLSSLSVSSPSLSPPASIHQTRLVPSGVHALTILCRAMKDPVLNPPTEDYHGYPADLHGDDETSKAKLARVAELAEQWAVDIDLSVPGVFDAKVEELAWFSAIVYGVGGWSTDRPFWADFFTVHVVTSSIFLPSVAHHLSTSSQTRLLRAYFAVSLAWYVTRGRQQLDLAGFFNSPQPPLGGQQQQQEVTPHRRSLQPAAFEHKKQAAGNPWLAIIQSANYHIEPHVVKTQRALAHWAQHLGDRPAGFFASLAEGPDAFSDAEKIDGSLFVRAAILTQNRLGWVREGDEYTQWDFDGGLPPWTFPDP